MPMLYEPGPNDEMCKCGRLAKKIHCPGCGSYTVTVLGMKWSSKRMMPDRTTKEFASFRCRRCAITFDDLEWRINCEAPRFETKSMKERRLQQDGMDAFQQLLKSKGGDRKEALRELFKNVRPVKAGDKLGSQLASTVTKTTLVEDE